VIGLPNRPIFANYINRTYGLGMQVLHTRINLGCKVTWHLQVCDTKSFDQLRWN